MTEDFPEIVVGAGVVGLCCALYRQREGKRVLMLDHREPGDGCSFGNSGLISGGQIVPDAMPGLARKVAGYLRDPEGPLAVDWSHLPHLRRWLAHRWRSSRRDRVDAIAAALAALGDHALPCFSELLGESGRSELLRQSGWLYLYETEGAFGAGQRGHELRRRHGIVLEDLDAVAIRRLIPAVRPDFARGLYARDAAYATDPKRLCLWLAERLIRGGGEIRRERVHDFELADGEVKAVVTDSARHPTTAIVLAAGAWSGALAARLGARVPLVAERGYHVAFPSSGIELAVPVLRGRSRGRGHSDAERPTCDRHGGVSPRGCAARPAAGRAPAPQSAHSVPGSRRDRMAELDGAAALDAGWAAGDRSGAARSERRPSVWAWSSRPCSGGRHGPPGRGYHRSQAAAAETGLRTRQRGSAELGRHPQCPCERRGTRARRAASARVFGLALVQQPFDACQMPFAKRPMGKLRAVICATASGMRSSFLPVDIASTCNCAARSR